MAAHERGAASRWTVLAVLCAALSVVVIDVTVLVVAAPAISEDLEPSAVQLLWIMDVYPLVIAPLLVAVGTLGDRLGRKRILLAGLVLFVIASLFCALAGTPGQLIAARAAMGVGGAMIMPGTMSIIRDVFRDRQERVKAVGIWSATLAGGAAVGPLVGGVLVEHFGWHSVFLVNLPVLALVLPPAIRFLPESRAEDPPPWDLASVAAAALGVLGLAWGVKQGARHGFLEPLPAFALLGGLLLLLWFARRQLRMPRPLIEVRLFASTTFSVAVVCVLLAMFGLVGLEFFLAQYLQLVLGLEPLAASLRLLPLMVATLIGSLSTAALLRRLGTRAVIAGGMAATSLALVPMLFLGTADTYALLAPCLVLMGFSLEVALVAANDVIISAVPADRAGEGAAIEETAYELGGGMGVAVLGSVLAAAYSAALRPVPGAGEQAMVAADESLAGAVDAAARLPAVVGEALLGTARAAYVEGFQIVLAVSVVLLAASASLAAVALRRQG